MITDKITVSETSSVVDPAKPDHMEEQQITHFEDSTSIVKSGKVSTLCPTTRCVTSETTSHEILDFLDREYVLAAFNWVGTDAFQSTVATINIPTDLLNIPQIYEKVHNFAYFKGAVKFRIVLNAQRFQCGRLIAVWEYFPGQVADPPTGDLTNWTGFPHIFIDAGQQPVVEFEVPYISTFAAYDLHNDGYDWGRLTLRVASALTSSTGTNTASVRVYGCFVKGKTQLQVPTPNPVLPTILAAREQREREIYEQGLADGMRQLQDLTFQSSESEATSLRGIVTDVAGTVAKVAHTFGNLGVPEMNTLGNAAGWVEDLLNPNSSTQQGYSKPLNIANTEKMSVANAWAYNSFNAASNAVPLSFDTRNCLNSDFRVFGTEQDEMDLNYICSGWNYLSKFVWNDTHVPLTRLWWSPVGPGACGETTLGNTQAASTHLAFVASTCEMWRGGIELGFSTVGNVFFSGRFRVSFWANHLSVTNPLASPDYLSAPHVICDLGESPNCVVGIPFTAIQAYKKVELFVPGRSSGPFDATTLQLTQTTGVIVVSVETVLNHPPTTSSSIEVLVSIRAGKDISFAAPTFPNFEPQSATRATSSNVPVSAVFVSDPSTKIIKVSECGISEIAPYSMGEAVTNARQMIRMMTPLASTGACTSVNIDPEYFGAAYDPQTPRDYWSRLYYMYKGSTRLNFWIRNLQTGGAVQIPFARARLYLQSGVPTAPVLDTPPTINAFSFTYMQNLLVNPTLEVQVPNYSRWFAKLKSNTTLFNSHHPKVVFDTFNPTPISFDGVIGLGAGDDFTFGLLKGAPPIRRT